MAEEPEETRKGAAKRLLSRIREADSQPNLLKAAAAVRRMAPGDSELGSRVATGDSRRTEALARAMTRGAEKDSVTRELGLTAVQLWQSLAEAQGRGRGEVDLAILFTDLVEFSSWALEAGDETAIGLLDDVGARTEKAVDAHGGDVVKRLGDGLMAVFTEPGDAVEAAHDAMGAVAGIECEGYAPVLRAGLHLGRPRKIAGDYLGVDVNVAARVAEAASGGELLVSGEAAERLGEGFETRRKRRFKAKGAPKDLEVFVVQPAGGG